MKLLGDDREGDAISAADLQQRLSAQGHTGVERFYIFQIAARIDMIVAENHPIHVIYLFKKCAQRGNHRLPDLGGNMNINHGSARHP